MAEQTWAGAIQSAGDVARILAEVNQQGLTRANTTALAEAVRPAEQTELVPDASRLLPAPEFLHGLLPWPGGLRKGATVAVTGSTTLLLMLLAAGMSQGSWAAVVGVPYLGGLAAHELGVPVDRLALVPNPGPDWPTVVAALIDGLDLVAVGVPGPVAEATVRSLQARARQKGCVLLPLTAWPNADLVIAASGRRWEGLGHGRGRLRRQVLEVQATGRGRAARPKTTTVIIGELDRPLRIPPPPPGLYDGEPARTAPRPSPPEAGAEHDLWADLLHNLPPTEPRRRR